MTKIKIVDLEAEFYTWVCPKCGEYNSVSLEEIFSNDKEVLCDDCNTIFKARIIGITPNNK